ncbi:MAG: hypothetical protein QXV32_03825 [Conexivisphaerales archaeon]
MSNIAGALKIRDPIRAFLKRCVVSSRRNGLWFKLTKDQRSLLSLSLTLKIKFESFALLRALVSVIKRLAEMGQGVYNAIIKGMRLAWAFSSAASSWGNKSASDWRNDRNYIIYLGTFYT